MRLLPPLLALTLVGCAGQPRLRPFETDGCSLFPDGTREQGRLWLDCCRRHDFRYWMGGTRKERLQADLELKRCVAAVGQPKVAKWMLRGARAGGTPYLPTSFRWGYGWRYPRGYGRLTDAERRLIAEPGPPGGGFGLETETRASSTTLDNVGPTSPDRVLPGEPAKRKSYLIPALEIPLFQAALNGFDRLAFGERDFGSTWKSGWRHLTRGPWVVDQDDFAINQIGHPYQGAMYHGSARASGLNFWEGLIYSNAGSFLWETFGETTHPSINDQVGSGTGGPLVGEPLFRMANLVLAGGEGRPGFWRELGAAFISPPTALNRLLFGERYTPILKSRNPAVFAQLLAGVGVNSRVRTPHSAYVVGRSVAVMDFAMAYGLPGRPGYLYLRPFDYFKFEATVMREGRADFANLMARGLLFGKKYEAGDSFQGLWGLYGSFDVFSPQVFRFSTTAASVGTTCQWGLSRKAALQGTALGGIGYGTAGTIVPQRDERDFHYGAAPQGLLALRLILGKLAMLDATARGYYLSGEGASRAPGKELITRLNASIFVRLYAHQALGMHYLLTSREARYSSASLPSRQQLVETIGIAYNLLGDVRFGAVDRERD